MQSYTLLDQPPLFPIGLSYVATALANNENDFEIKTFDMNVHEKPFEALADAVKSFQPDVVGISLRNIKVAKAGKHENCLELHRNTVQTIRNNANNAKIIAGGTAFSLYAETVMKDIPEIDIGFFGEGEERFPQLLKTLNDPSKIKGIYYRTSNGKVEFTGYPELLDFSKMPPPNREFFDINLYKDNPICIGIISKKGCMLNCEHCSDKYLSGSKLRQRNPKDVVDEIENLHKKHDIKYFFFTDHIFNIPPDHAKDICREIINRKLDIGWSGWFNEKEIDEELLILCRDSGCYLVDCSPDGVDNRVLKGYRKTVTEEDLNRVADLCKKVRIRVTFSFMLNGPHDTFGTILKMLSFLIKTKIKLGKYFLLHSSCMVLLRIYPHSDLQKLAVEKGVIAPNDTLIEPRFYNQPPLKYLADFILFSINVLWNIKQVVKKIVSNK